MVYNWKLTHLSIFLSVWGMRYGTVVATRVDKQQYMETNLLDSEHIENECGMLLLCIMHNHVVLDFDARLKKINNKTALLSRSRFELQ